MAEALFLAAALAAQLVGCRGGVPTADAGVEGSVTTGPVCPVVQVGQECPDEPYPAELTIVDARGKAVGRATADAEGRYRIPLAPGEYVLEARAADDLPFPAGVTVAFTVLEGAWTRLDMTLDSGIR